MYSRPHILKINELELEVSLAPGFIYQIPCINIVAR